MPMRPCLNSENSVQNRRAAAIPETSVDVAATGFDRVGPTKRVGAALALFFACLGQAQAQSTPCTVGDEQLVTYDFNAPAVTWNAGDLTDSVTVGTGAGQTTLGTTVVGGNHNAGTPYIGTRGSFANSLNIEVNRTTNVETNTITFTFGRAITKLRFVAADLDYAANNYRDRVTVTGTDALGGASTPVAAATIAANVTAAANVATATTVASCGDASAACNATFDFSTPVKVVTLVYSNFNVTGNPTEQYIGISNLDFCVPTVARVAVSKTTTADVGTFNFTNTNLASAVPAVTTVTAGTAATSAQVDIATLVTTTTISETIPAGWSLTGATCSDSNGATSGNSGTFSTFASPTVTIPAANAVGGARITCNFANVRFPRLTLVKTVTNDDGGSAVATAWTLNAVGPSSISGATGSVAVTNVYVPSGTYALSETGGPSTYTASAWSCAAGTLVGSNLTLANGVVSTCTINNNDQKIANLTVTKTNGVGTLVSGASTTYTVVFTNGGPSQANSAIVVDPVVPGLSCTTAVCSAAGGAQCPGGAIDGAGVSVPIASLQAGIAVPTFPISGTVSFAVTCSVTATGL
jgi:hypothetical protein